MHITAQESFWDFSNRVYRNSEVSTTCLFLQNSYGLDVNLLLFGCWHAHTRGMCTVDLLDDALAFSSMWSDNVVKPLRSARTWLKNNTDSDQSDQEVTEGFNLLRQQIKKLELECEQFQENMLESLVMTFERNLSAEKRISAAIFNLRAIVEASAPPLNATLAGGLAKLILLTLDEPVDDDTCQAICTRLMQ